MFSFDLVKKIKSTQISLKTCYGQLLDLKSVVDRSGDKFKDFTNSRLETIFKYKTSYYTFVIPVKLGKLGYHGKLTCFFSYSSHQGGEV